MPAVKNQRSKAVKFLDALTKASKEAGLVVMFMDDDIVLYDPVECAVVVDAVTYDDAKNYSGTYSEFV